MVGGVATWWAYDSGLLSWSGTTSQAPLIVMELGILGALSSIIFLLLRRSERGLRGSLAAFLGIWLGVGIGALAPGIAGETPVWRMTPESVAYRLDVVSQQLPVELMDQVNNPLEGERSTLNYLAPLSDGGNLMVSSVGSEYFDLSDEGQAETWDQISAVATSWTAEGEMTQAASLSAVAPDVRLVRGIFFDEAASILYVSNARAEPDCGGLDLWSFAIDVESLDLSEPSLLFETTPCLSGISGHNQFGGRIAQDAEGVVYLSVGEYGNGLATVRDELADGPFSGRPELLQDPNTYGVVVEVSKDGAWQVVSRGHRNPQGLHYDSATQTLLLSEHGAKGGDEVNVIEQGQDYGWPDVTYAGPYGGNPQPDPSWSIDRWYGTNHGDFTEPLFTWLPSIAASQLLVYGGDEFPAWDGDILLASFKGNIHRLRVVDDRVVFDEEIAIGTRPRDLIELSDGRLRVTTDDNRVLTIGIGSSE